MGIKVALKNVRLSFHELTSPKSFENTESDKKYQGTFILDPSVHAEELKQLSKAVKASLMEKFNKIPKSFKNWVVKDGNDCLDKEEEIRGGYEDMQIVTSSSKKRPFLVDASGECLSVEEADTTFYGGCWVGAVVDVFAYDNPFGKGVTCSLCTVQFVRDGESFGGSSSNVDEDLSLLGNTPAANDLI